MTPSSIVLIGGGGHCRSVIDLLRLEGKFTVHGILDRDDLVGTSVMGVPIIGTDDDLERMARTGFGFLVTAGHVGDAGLRERLYDRVRSVGGELISSISPLAHLASDTRIGPGTSVGHGAIINSGARIGGNCIINTKALVEHDTHVGDHVHVATGAIVNGDCHVGDRSLIGSGAIILQGVRIGERAIVGAGSVVLRDVPPGTTVAGCPAKAIRP